MAAVTTDQLLRNLLELTTPINTLPAPGQQAADTSVPLAGQRIKPGGDDGTAQQERASRAGQA